MPTHLGATGVADPPGLTTLSSVPCSEPVSTSARQHVSTSREGPCVCPGAQEEEEEE